MLVRKTLIKNPHKSYLIESNEEGWQDGDGPCQQDPLPSLPSQVEEALQYKVWENRNALISHKVIYNTQKNQQFSIENCTVWAGNVMCIICLYLKFYST